MLHLPQSPHRIADIEAIRTLIEFLREYADLDDLARLYSAYISDAEIVVADEYGSSDVFCNGEAADDSVDVG